MKSSIGFFLSSIALAGIVHAAEIDGQQRAMMIEAARADVVVQLARQIKGLQLSGQTVVGNFVTEEKLQEAVVSALVKGARIGEPRFIGDICIVDGELTIEQVIENLKKIDQMVGGIKVNSWTDVQRHNEYKTVRAQGTGTVKAPEDKPEQGAVMAQDTGLEEALATLEGPGQKKLGALEAARIDAYVQLLNQIKGIQVDSESVVYNCATEESWTTTSASGLVKGAQVQRYAALGKDIIGCTVAITIDQVVENLQTRTRRGFLGRKITTQIVKRHNPNLITVKATGYGAIGKNASQMRQSGVIVGTVQ